MKKYHEQSVIINKTPAEIYDFLAVPTNHATFVPGLLEFDTEPPGADWAIGTTAIGKRKAAGVPVKESGVMVEKIPNERIVWDMTMMGVTSRGMWKLEAVDGGTRVALGGEVDTSLVMRVLQAFGIADIEGEQRKALRALQQRLA